MIEGNDISLWQDDNSTPQRVNFEQMRKRSRFVFIKASQSTYIDPDYIYNWDNAIRAGMPRAAYHFLTWATMALLARGWAYARTRHVVPSRLVQAGLATGLVYLFLTRPY